MPPKITSKILPISLVSHWKGVVSIKASRKGRIQGIVEETDEDEQTVSDNWAKSEKDRKTEGDTNGKKRPAWLIESPQQTCRCDI